MDSGVMQTAQQDEVGTDATNLVNALSAQSWVAAALAAVVLVLALLKKFGVIGAKKVDPPAPVATDAENDKAADAARALLGKDSK